MIIGIRSYLYKFGRDERMNAFEATVRSTKEQLTDPPPYDPSSLLLYVLTAGAGSDSDVV